MTTFTAHSFPYQPVGVGRAARRLLAATAAAAALAGGAYGLWRAVDSGFLGAANAGAGSLSLADRVVPMSVLSGYVPAGRPTIIHIHAPGFVAGVAEQFRADAGQGLRATSIVEQYSSPAGAATVLARHGELSVAGGYAHRFSVIGIPTAAGWALTSRVGGGVSVAFTHGSFYYLIRASLPTDGRLIPVRGQITRAAQMSYLLSYGCVATRSMAPRHTTIGPLH